MRQHKTTLISAALALGLSAFSSVSSATSYFQERPGIPIGETQTRINFYEYPAPAEVRDTGILFFYTQAVLRDYFDGDPMKLYEFIDQSITVNNRALSNGGIGLQRHSVGVLPMPEDFDDSGMYTTDRSAVRYFTEKASGLSHYNGMVDVFGSYKASYYVLIAKRDVPEGMDASANWVGKAILGDNAAIVTPYENTDHLVTVLGHELGHTDGLRHNVTSSIQSAMLTEYALGDFCDDNYSMMDSRGFSYSGEYFFSDPAHTDISTGEPCGETGVADAAASYREGLELIEEKRQEGEEDFSWPFRTIVDMNAPDGLATIDVENTFVNEATGAITGSVVWTQFNNIDEDNVELPHGSFELVVDYASSSVTQDDIVGDGIVTLKYDGRMRTNFTIQLADDDQVEVDETLVLKVKNTNGLTIANGITEVTYTISSDDTGNPGVFGFVENTLTVDEGNNAVIRLRRTGGSDGEVVLRVESLNGSALAGTDFEAVNEFVTFGPGETEKQVIVRTRSDDTQDDESFTVIIVNDDVETDVAEITVNINDTTTDNNNGGETPTPPPSSGGGGGGGSLGGGMMLLFGLSLWRRVTR